MKYIILNLILVIGTLLFAQEEIKPKKSVMDFITTVENYSKGYDRTNMKELFKSKHYTDQEVISLAKKYYTAKAEDPVGFHFYEKKTRQEFEEKFKNNSSERNELMLPEKVGIIHKIISSKFGKTFTDVISIPWYLKINVLDIKRGKFKSSIGDLGKTYLVAKIEEVIKGKSFFSEGDTIEINFLGNWLPNANKQYEKGKSYFVGLREWDCYSGNCTEIALYVFPDQDDGIYQIENGNVIAPNNFFGIDDNLQWSKFKSEFIKRYIL